MVTAGTAGKIITTGAKLGAAGQQGLTQVPLAHLDTLTLHPAQQQKVKETNQLKACYTVSPVHWGVSSGFVKGSSRDTRYHPPDCPHGRSESGVWCCQTHRHHTGCEGDNR